MAEVTRLLVEIESGDRRSADKLLPLVYEELRKLAAARLGNEKPGQTLQATALVHEAYVRLVGGEVPAQSWQGRGHFFAAAAEAMRRILVEAARRKSRDKHGGGWQRTEIDGEQFVATAIADPYLILAIHESLERLVVQSPRKAELVKLRFYVGCTMAEAAEILGIAEKTAEADWTYARAWLRREWLRQEASYGDLENGDLGNS
jgi:RNA polymerase sigma factor (TIGR02999 family)